MNTQLDMALPLPSTSAEGRRARDRGLKRTESSNAWWLVAAVTAMRRFCADQTEITVEAFRHWWQAQADYVAPTSHHAYGALGRAAKRAGFIRFSRFELAKSVKTRAHPIRVYEVVRSA